MRTRVNYDVRKLTPQDVAFTDVTTSGTLTFTYTGFLVLLFVKVPNFTNSITLTIALTDEDGNELYTKASIAKNQTEVIHVENDYIPLYGEVTATLTLSGAAGGSGGTVTVTPIVK